MPIFYKYRKMRKIFGITFCVLLFGGMFFVSGWTIRAENAAGQPPVLYAVDSGVQAITPPDSPVFTDPEMKWADTRSGLEYSKDPSVIRWRDHFMMYYSYPPPADGSYQGWTIGIAQCPDSVNDDPPLTQWVPCGRLIPTPESGAAGFAAPCAVVHNNKVHLFFQSYGGGKRDAIWHATSDDGVNFTLGENNPIFRPSGDWNCGRAIDAEVRFFKDKWFLFCATRDPEMKIQKLVVATAPEGTDFGPESWTQASDVSCLEPALPWDTKCIEAPSVYEKNGRLYMFYAGGYNNDPQQIGVAESPDGIHWTRLWEVPFLSNGKIRDGKPDWNLSESGHPGVFDDPVTGRTWLFFQGNNDHGKTWYLSRVEVVWKQVSADGTEDGPPHVIPEISAK